MGVLESESGTTLLITLRTDEEKQVTAALSGTKGPRQVKDGELTFYPGLLPL